MKVNRFWQRAAATMLFAALLSLSTFAVAGEDTSDSRKVKVKIAPAYPELAKKLNVSGSVKLEVLVGPNGAVKSVKPLGGHPVLVDAAVDAVKQWKYEPGTEDVQVVEVKFAPIH